MAAVVNTDHPAGASAAQAAVARAWADGASLRVVQQARLTLAPGSSAFAAQAALEDALRTADFADAGRLIVVRSLSLKGLPRGATGPQVARALERAWQALAPSALPFDAPGAAAAAVVYFRSMHDARLAWLQRFAGDTPADEWFWPRALPELAGAADPPSAMISVLAQLQAGAPVVLAQRLQALPATALQRLLAALPVTVPAALAGVLPAPGAGVNVPTPSSPAIMWQPTAMTAPSPVSPSVSHTAADMPAAAEAPDPPAWPEPHLLPTAVAQAVAQWPGPDWRPRWLVALVLHARTGASVPAHEVEQAIAASAAVHTATPAPAARRLRAAVGTPPAGADAPLGPPRIAGPPDLVHPPAAAHHGSPAAATPPGPAPMADHFPADPPGAASRPRAPPRWAHACPWLATGDDTDCGGLLMLLNALAVLQLPAWLAHQPPALQPHFARALLARLAGRLRLPPDDPHRMLLTLPDGTDPTLQHAGCQWQGFAWPLGFDAQGLRPAGTSTAAALACWQRALVRLLRRHAGLGLVRLVRRVANVAVTPTHVDVVLPLAQADVALRRHGLDRNPGWLPWFGWIVNFHYVDLGIDQPASLPEVRHAG